MTPTNGEVWLFKGQTLVSLPISLKRRDPYGSSPEMRIFSHPSAEAALLSFLICLPALVGCSRGAPSPHAPGVAPTSGTARLRSPSELRLELNEDELRIERALDEHTRAFLSHGQRDIHHPWDLLESVEYVSAVLQGQGLPVERATADKDGVILHSFAVSVRGEDLSMVPWTIAASYDSLSPRLASGPGIAAEELGRGALETAAWLELVRQLGQARLERGVRFLLLARPSGDDQADVLRQLAGSSRSAGVFYLGGGLGARELALYSGGQEAGLLRALADELGAVPSEPGLRLGFLTASSPMLPFLAADSLQPSEFTQILVAGRSSEQNLKLAALRVSAMRRALGSFLGERPTNDEMVTPLYGALR